jgi:hypothetical protein
VAVHWEVRGTDRWIAQMQQIADNMLRSTGKSVDYGMTLIQVEAQHQLSRLTHPPGTPTPAPPGGPPALISGTLRRSIKGRGPRQTGPGRFEGQVGPTVVYGRIQELGGTIVAHGQYLRWFDANGRAFFKHSVTLPARPYMWYAVTLTRDEIHEAFVRSWNFNFSPREG